VVGTRRADAVPEGLTDRCPKCASGDARLQRGVPGSDRLSRRFVQNTPGRARRRPGWRVAVQPCWTAARDGHACAATRADCLPRHREAWTRSVCPIAAARPLRRCAWGLEPRPRQALGVLVWEATVDNHNRDALCPGLALVLRHREGLSSRCCSRPCAHRQHPRRPGVAEILAPPYAAAGSTATRFPRSAAWRASWRHCCCPATSASRAKTRSLTSLIQSQRQSCTPKRATHPQHAGGEQRQRIKRPFAHPQWCETCLQRCGVEEAFRTWEMILALGFGDLLCSPDGAAVEIHHMPVWCGVRKHHATTAPVADGVRPGAWRRIAHAVLLHQGQRNAPLLQVGGTTASRQGSLERDELLGKVRPHWSGRTRWWWRQATRGGLQVP